MPKLTGPQRKQAYFQTLTSLLDQYPKVLVVHADNVGSKQMQQIRIALRGSAVMLMGKNTTVRKAMRAYIQNNPKVEALLNQVRGNVGFIFCDDLKQAADVVKGNRVEAPARAGGIAPNPVMIPPGSTGLDPAQTSFFQALSIPTKISKGAIEIINEVALIDTGDKVTPSQAALLTKLKIRPFTYGLEIRAVYDNGNVYDPEVLDITDEILANFFGQAVDNLAAVSLAIGASNLATAKHEFVDAVKNVCAISVETDYDIEATKMAKAFLADPEAFAAANASAAPAAGAGAAAAAAPEEEEEEGDDDMGFGLFD